MRVYWVSFIIINNMIFISLNPDHFFFCALNGNSIIQVPFIYVSSRWLKKRCFNLTNICCCFYDCGLFACNLRHSLFLCSLAVLGNCLYWKTLRMESVPHQSMTISNFWLTLEGFHRFAWAICLGKILSFFRAIKSEFHFYQIQVQINHCSVHLFESERTQ